MIEPCYKKSSAILYIGKLWIFFKLPEVVANKHFIRRQKAHMEDSVYEEGRDNDYNKEF